MCRGQCYDGAANMKKVACEIKVIEPTALYLHCFGHSPNLAAADTLRRSNQWQILLIMLLKFANY